MSEAGYQTISVTLPTRLASAVLGAAAAVGQRTGPESIKLEHFVILSEKSFERLLDCGGAERAPGRGCAPAPAASPDDSPA